MSDESISWALRATMQIGVNRSKLNIPTGLCCYLLAHNDKLTRADVAWLEHMRHCHHGSLIRSEKCTFFALAKKVGLLDA